MKMTDGLDLWGRVVTLDDGRKAVVLGVSGDRWSCDLSLMLGGGERLDAIPPERVTDVGRSMPNQNGSRPKPWPEPWEAAHLRLRADVQANKTRKVKRPSKKVAARIEARLAERRRILAWRAEQEARAWRADDDPAAILTEARQRPGAYAVHLDRWLWLKTGAPDRLVLYWSGLYVYTYHVDALQVSKVKELPPTHPYWITTDDGPVVLIFDEFYTDLEELLVPLVAVDVKVALVLPGWHDSPSQVELFDDGADVQRYFDSERTEYEAEVRKAAVEKTGVFQESLPGFESAA